MANTTFLLQRADKQLVFGVGGEIVVASGTLNEGSALPETLFDFFDLELVKKAPFQLGFTSVWSRPAVALLPPCPTQSLIDGLESSDWTALMTS